MDAKTVEKNFKFHHRSFKRGYQSVKQPTIVSQYAGRFGEGWTIEHPSLRERVNGKISNRFHAIDYYVKES